MSVPSHWRTALLDDLCDKITDGTHHSPSEDDQTPQGDFAYVTAKNIKEGGIDLSRITYLSARIHNPIFERCNPEKGDVLYIKDGATTGIATVNQLDEPFSMLSSVALLKPKRNVLEPRFLKWFLNSPTGYSAMTSQMTGTAIKRLTLTKIKEASAPVAPLPEQRRIVAKIEELFSDLDAGVAALERVRANLKRYRAAVLKAAVEGRLTAAWRERNPTPPDQTGAALLQRILAERRAKWEQDQLRKFKEKGGAGKTPPKGWKEKYEPPIGPTEERPDDLPATWSWCTIEQAAADLPRAIQSGPFGSNLLHSEFQETGVLAIGIDSVQSGRFSLGSGHRISQEKFVELQKYEARPLDFLITVMATVGRCCVVPADLERAIITKHVYRVSLETRLINSYFLQAAVLGGPIVKRQIFGEVRGQTRPGINGEILRQVAVPIPPLAEQSAIVAEVDRRLSVADAAEQQVEHALQRAARLRQSILKRAFEGKLVPQDPTDEPAATMLERAKAPTNGHRAVIETSGTPRRDTPKRRSRARA